MNTTASARNSRAKVISCLALAMVGVAMVDLAISQAGSIGAVLDRLTTHANVALAATNAFLLAAVMAAQEAGRWFTWPLGVITMTGMCLETKALMQGNTNIKSRRWFLIASVVSWSLLAFVYIDTWDSGTHGVGRVVFVFGLGGPAMWVLAVALAAIFSSGLQNIWRAARPETQGRPQDG